ncbi:MAG: hypothetical protein ACXWCK_30080 [Burkholderiales bacterium]
MFMLLGVAVFIVLIGSAVLGFVMLVTASALIVTRTWRRAGLRMLGAGGIGASCGIGVLLIVNAFSSGNSPIPLETWLMFAAGGFGWFALICAVVAALIALLRQPNRWVERRRNANA